MWFKNERFLLSTFQQILGNIYVDFCLNVGKCFLLEDSLQNQEKEYKFS